MHLTLCYLPSMKKVFLLISSFFLIVSYSIGQESKSKKEVRKQKTSFLVPGKPWTAELPIWVPGFAGTFAYGDVEIEGEDGVNPENPIEPPPGFDFGKIISRLFQDDWYLKFFFLTKITYEKNKLLVQFDAISGSVGGSVKFKLNDSEIVQANFQTINFRLFAGYKLFEAISDNGKFKYELFGYLGTRVHFHRIYSDLNNAINNLDISPRWVEPLMGIQNQFTFKRWLIVLQGDYGGFLVNSKYSDQISFFTYYRTGKVSSIKVGWNHLQLNHSGTFQKEDYKIKATFSGPSVGITFHF